MVGISLDMSLSSGDMHFNNTAFYIFVPVNLNFKISIAVGYGILAVGGAIANILILYFIATQTSLLGYGASFSRQKLINRYIQSLALSDVFCSLFSIPLFTIEMMFDLIQTDLVCKLVRIVTMSFVLITVMSHIVIAIERYLAVFYPFYLPSDQVCRRVVVVAWFVGFLFQCLVLPTYNLVRFDLPDETFTLVCKYDNSVPIYKVLFLVFVVSGYVLPSFILSFTSISIVRFLYRRKRQIDLSKRNDPENNVANFKDTKENNNGKPNDDGSSPDNGNSGDEHLSPRNNNQNLQSGGDGTETNNGYPKVEGSNAEEARNLAYKFKLTRMFVKITIAFVIPYISFIVYSSIIMAFKIQVTFQIDYIARHVSSLLVFTNGIVSPIIIFYDNRYLQRRLIKLLCN